MVHRGARTPGRKVGLGVARLARQRRRDVFGIEGLPLASVPLWHWMQFDEMPAWFIGVPGPKATKFVLEWQVSQASVVGTWLA